MDVPVYLHKSMGIPGPGVGPDGGLLYDQGCYKGWVVYPKLRAGLKDVIGVLYAGSSGHLFVVALKTFTYCFFDSVVLMLLGLNPSYRRVRRSVLAPYVLVQGFSLFYVALGKASGG